LSHTVKLKNSPKKIFVLILFFLKDCSKLYICIFATWMLAEWKVMEVFHVWMVVDHTTKVPDFVQSLQCMQLKPLPLFQFIPMTNSILLNSMDINNSSHIQLHLCTHCNLAALYGDTLNKDKLTIKQHQQINNYTILIKMYYFFFF
jgi:hypothetical protein